MSLRAMRHAYGEGEPRALESSMATCTKLGRRHLRYLIPIVASLAGGDSSGSAARSVSKHRESKRC